MTANRIIHHIFNQPDLRQVDQASLEQLVEKYPYFAAARMFLARKEFTDKQDLTAISLKRAQLYSGTPHQVHQFVTASLLPGALEKNMAVMPEKMPTPVEAAALAAEEAVVPGAPVQEEAAAPVAVEAFGPAATATGDQPVELVQEEAVAETAAPPSNPEPIPFLARKTRPLFRTVTGG